MLVNGLIYGSEDLEEQALIAAELDTAGLTNECAASFFLESAIYFDRLSLLKGVYAESETFQMQVKAFHEYQGAMESSPESLVAQLHSRVKVINIINYSRGVNRC